MESKSQLKGHKIDKTKALKEIYSGSLTISSTCSIRSNAYRSKGTNQLGHIQRELDQYKYNYIKLSQIIYKTDLDSGLNKRCSFCIIPKFINKGLQKKHFKKINKIYMPNTM